MLSDRDEKLKQYLERYKNPGPQPWRDAYRHLHGTPPDTVADEIRWLYDRKASYPFQGVAPFDHAVNNLRAVIAKLPPGTVDHLMPENDNAELARKLKAEREAFNAAQMAKYAAEAAEARRREEEQRVKDAEEKRLKEIADAEQAKAREEERLKQAEARKSREQEQDLEDATEKLRIKKAAENAVAKEVSSARTESLREGLRPIPVNAFIDTVDAEREWLVSGVIVAGEPMLLGGPKKILKTSISIDLALSIAAGVPFLGTYNISRPRSVAMYSGESGSRTLRETVRRVAKARGIDLSTLTNFALQTSLPLLSDASAIEAMRLEAEPYDVVIIDPLYIALGGDANTASLTGIGAQLSALTEALTGKTLIILHHTLKDTWSGRLLDLTDLAFAGVAEFARQWFLINRHKRFDPSGSSAVHQLGIAFGGSAGQHGSAFVEIDEGTLAERRWAVSVKPWNDRPSKKANSADTLMVKLLTVLFKAGAAMKRTRLRTAIGRSSGDTSKVIKRAVEAGWAIEDSKGVALTPKGRERIPT